MDVSGNYVATQKFFSKVVLPGGKLLQVANITSTDSNTHMYAVPPIPEIPRLLKADVQIPQAQLGGRLRVCSYNVLAEVFSHLFCLVDHFFFVRDSLSFSYFVLGDTCRFIQARHSTRIVLCGL